MDLLNVFLAKVVIASIVLNPYLLAQSFVVENLDHANGKDQYAGCLEVSELKETLIELSVDV